MYFNAPEILSETLEIQDGVSGTKYRYADGSIGFKPHDTENLTVIAPDQTKTTYNSELLRLKVEKPDGIIVTYYDDKNNRRKMIERPNGEVSFYFNDKNNRLESLVGSDNTLTIYENSKENLPKYKYESVDRTTAIEDREENNDGDYYDYYLWHHSAKIEYSYRGTFDGEKYSDIYETKTYSKNEKGFFTEEKHHNGRLTYRTIYQGNFFTLERYDYFDDENNRLHQSFKEGEGTKCYFNDENHNLSFEETKDGWKSYYNNEAHSLEKLKTLSSYAEYAEDGTETFLENNLGNINSIREYDSGNISSISGSDGYKKYYDNEAHTIKEEVNKFGVGFTYDEDGNKTALIVKDQIIPIKDGKPTKRLIEADGDKFLFNDDCKLIVRYDSKDKSYYYGDGDKFIEEEKNYRDRKITKIHLKDGSTDTLECNYCIIHMTERGLEVSLSYEYTDENWGATVNQDYNMDLNGKISTYESLDGRREEIDQDGTYIRRNKDREVTSFGNPHSGLSWKVQYGSPFRLYITKRDGMNMEGYEEFWPFSNGHMKERINFSCDNEGNITKRYENGNREESNLRDHTKRRYDAEDNLLFECDKNGHNEKYYNKSPNGKMRLSAEKADWVHSTEYDYNDENLKEIRYRERDRVVQRDVFNDEGRKVCSFEYYTKIGALGIATQGKVSKATYYNPDNQTKDVIKEFDQDGNEISEIKYDYYEGTNKVVAITEKVEGRKKIRHYKINGVEDTAIFLAQQRVKEQKEKNLQKIEDKLKTAPKFMHKLTSTANKQAKKIAETQAFTNISLKVAINKIKKSRGE